MEWKNVFRGMLMGISDLVPGVSGGTIALVLGIYERFLKALNGFFSKEWKKHIGFLVPLGIGIGLALLIFSKMIDYLLEYHFASTQFFFMGLIVGIVPFIIKEADVRNHFTWKHYAGLILIAVLLAIISMVNPPDVTPITSLSGKSVLGLFFAGWLGSMAMLLPGISGSFVLLLLGVYSTAISALSSFNIPILLVMGLGVAVGFVVSSKGISYLLRHYMHATYAVIIGLIIGSLFAIFPGIPTGTALIGSLISFICGIIISNVLTRYS